MNKPLILVVEDDPSVRNLITTTLKTKPCRRGQTVTGSGAGRTFRFGSPPQFTTDRNLPFVEYAGEKKFSARTGFSSGDFQNLARR